MANSLKKRKVRKLKDMIDRKVDPGKGNPKTTNRVKPKTTVVKPKADKSTKSPIRDFIEKSNKDFAEKLEKDKNLPVRVEQPKKIRGNPNLAKTPGVIKQGYTPGSASRAVAPYSGASKTATSAIKEGLKFGSKILGAAAFIVDPSFMSTKTGGAAGEGSDKPTGPLMKGNRENKIPGGTGRSKPGRGISTVNKPSVGPENRQLEKPKGQPYGMTYLQKPKGQPYGMNVAPPGGPPSGTGRPKPTATAGTGTSTGATEKLSAFERLKARQYEREGYGGRVMTRKKATEQVMKERQYKSPLAGLFKRKGK